MKKVNELGISPAPWVTALNADGEHALDVVAPDYTVVAGCVNTKDARLIAAAPKLYECLREAIIVMCHSFECCGGGVEYTCNGKQDCFIKRWREVLDHATNEGTKENDY